MFAVILSGRFFVRQRRSSALIPSWAVAFSERIGMVKAGGRGNKLTDPSAIVQKEPFNWFGKEQVMGWEYQTVSFDFSSEAFLSQGGLFNSRKFNRELNRLGWDGWELVNVFDTNRVKGSTKFVVAVLKRPLTDERRMALQQSMS
ncbi:MAG: DUF4177 domain-containing protein [Fuerstiella sp.]